MNKKFNIMWLTGQPGAGKTTLSNEIVRIIKSQKQFNDIEIIQIDGDDLRDITENKDYSKKGRMNNIKLSQHLALFCQNKGFLVVVSLVSPYLELRENFKSRTNVNEFYIFTNEARGKEHYFSKDYVKPKNDFISIDTTEKTINESAKEILSFYW